MTWDQVWGSERWNGLAGRAQSKGCGVRRPEGVGARAALAVVCSIATGLLGGCGAEFGGFGGWGIPHSRPGVLAAAEAMMLPVPGGKVNAYGGNLFIERKDLSVDTQLGTWSVGAVWNSATGAWLWNFDSKLRVPQPGSRPIFVDATGYAIYLRGQAFGKPIPGTTWVFESLDSVRTLGGLVYHYDGEGELETVHWGSAAYPSLSFDRERIAGHSRVMSIEQCLGAGDCSTLYAMQYDAIGRLLSIVDLAGRTSLFTYDGPTMRIASARDALDVANGWPGFRYEYDEQGRLSAITNAHDERVEYRYYAKTKMVLKVEQQAPGEPVWAFAYEPLNYEFVARTTVVDPLGATSSYVYDIHLRLWRHTNAAGESRTWSWLGDTYNRSRETSFAGVERSFASPDEDTALETLESGNVITRSFAPWPAENRQHPRERALLSLSDHLGPIETRSYSVDGVLEAVSNGAGETTTYLHGPAGEISVTDPAGVLTIYGDRGSHGHYGSRTRGARTVLYAYDAIGNLLSADGLLDADERLDTHSIGQGGIVSRGYDADRNLALLVLEDGGESATGAQRQLTLAWRADGKRLRIDRPYAGDTEFLYDAAGRMVEERTRVDGLWSRTQFEYDAVGRRTAVLRPNGMASRMAYDLAGKLASIVRERDWNDPVEFDSRAELDSVAGRIVAIRDSAHGMVPEAYFYDPGGAIEQVQYPAGESLLFARDVRGRVASKQFLRADMSVLRTFDFDYDAADRLVEVREDGAPISTRVYVNGLEALTLYGNGVSVVNSYEPTTGRFAGFAAFDSAQQSVASMTVTTGSCSVSLPASDCVIDQTDSLLGVLETSYSEYQLEDLGTERLIADAVGFLASSEGFYTYDELSNLVQSPAGDFVYNAERNRLLSIEDQGVPLIDYLYDAAGFVTSRGGTPVTWNGMGRIRSVGSDFAMTWDSFGRKVSATSEGVETHWRYGAELSQNGAGAAQKFDLGWVLIDLDTASHEYRLSDFRGNAKLLLNDAGEVTAHHHYTGFDRWALAGTDPSGKGFAQGSHLGDLVVLGVRVYDPLAARFLSEDPLYQTINQYAYTLGNPIRFWDPGGDHGILTSSTTKVGFVGPLPFVEFGFESRFDHEHDAAQGVAGDSGGDGQASGGGGAEGGANSSGSSGGGGAGPGVGGIGGSGIDVNIHCGLGFEIVPALAMLLWRRRIGRRTGRRRSRAAR